MTAAAVVIPFRASDPTDGDDWRLRALRYVRARYETLGLPVVVSGIPDGDPWSKGLAVRLGVEKLSGYPDVLLVADADSIVHDRGIYAIVDAVADGAAWAQPHGTVVRLRPGPTRLVYDSGSPLRPRPGRVDGPHGGGIVAVSAAAYETAGGPDPRFEGWGGEDISWARALDTLAGPGVRFRYALAHLYHHPTPRRAGNRASPESEVLAGRYLDAAGDPAAMRSLVDEFHVRDSTGRWAEPRVDLPGFW